MANKTSKWLVLLAVPCIVVITTVAYLVLAPAKWQETEQSIVIDTTNQPTLGKESAKAHIVAFEDLKCVNCAIFNNTLFQQIKKRYIDTGLAKYTLFNVAFIKGSLPAANAAHCLYEQKPAYFFNFVDYIYRIQPPEDQHWATTARLLQFARKSVPQADLKRLSQCIIQGKYNRFIKENLKYTNQLMKNHVSTPTIYINGRQLKVFDLDTIEQLMQQPPEQEP